MSQYAGSNNYSDMYLDNYLDCLSGLNVIVDHALKCCKVKCSLVDMALDIE